MLNKHAKVKRASLNHTYRSVWSDTKQMYVVAAEISSGKGKSSAIGAVAALMMGCGGVAHALDPGTLPQGANITHGQAQIQQSQNVMNIHQSTDKLITNWNSFNVGQDATVNFHQPNSNSAALNRVMDNNPSQIHGRINANGNVYLVNPSGILFGKTAQVDVGGLIASTLDISDQDFLNNKLDFKNLGFSDGDIKNLGHIKANGGVVALIANQVSNQGTIAANNAKVALAAGNHVTLDFNGDGLMTVSVEQGVLDALAENGGLIQADGGFVIMTTQAKNDIYRNLVNNDGLIQAQSLASKDGRIMLMGGMSQGQVVAGGKLDASAPTEGNGGFIETSAAKVNIQPDLHVTTKAENGKTGEWLIDPNDYTVADSGGDITGQQLSTNLGNTNVTIQSVDGGTSGNGDILVKDNITWSSGNTLTLNAIRNIDINATIDASAGAGGKLVLEYGQGAVAAGNTATYDFGLSEEGFAGSAKLQAGQNFSTKLGTDGAAINYTVVTALGSQGINSQNNPVDGLQSIPFGTSGNYALGANIDASDTRNWTSAYGDGFISLSLTNGRFDGLGNTVDSLYVRSNSQNKALFGSLNGATVKNIGVTNIDLAANANVGAVVGSATNNAVIDSVFATGKVMLGGGQVGTQAAAGGVLGKGSSVIVRNSHSSVEVEGSGDIGGLVGSMSGASTIENSFATGDVKVGAYRGGGLVGMMRDGSKVTGSYATGDVIATGDSTQLLGGIAGSAGNIGSTAVGGVSDSYYLGTIQGGVNYVGGILGNISSPQYVILSNVFYDKDKNPGITGDRLYGKTTAQITDLGFYEPVCIIVGMPSCGTVMNGNGTIGDIVDKTLTINQTAEKLIIEWKQFDIAAGNTVHFDQQGHAHWFALNRVTANNPSEILGHLTADGRVYLINPSGILFGANAQVDVAGLIASNLNITNTDFTAGNLNFASGSGGYVSVQSTTEDWQLGEDGLTLASGSDFTVDENAPAETASGISTDALQNRLADHAVALQVSKGGAGNISLQTDVNWATDNTLTLTSDNSIQVNATLKNTSTNDGGVRFYAGDKVAFGEEGLVEVYNANQLQRMNQALAGNYELRSNIDLSEFKWTPVGADLSYAFTGKLDGLDHTISNLTMLDLDPNAVNQGLFGATNGATIQDINLADVNITGSSNYVGGLVGITSGGTIKNVQISGDVTGNYIVGGLIGYGSVSNNELNISNAFSAVNVTGSNDVGGLIGNATAATSENVAKINISQSRATGNVFGTTNAGGLIGRIYAVSSGDGSAEANILNAYAIGRVEGTSNVGGLVGDNENGKLENTYASGEVKGDAKVGGLIGESRFGVVNNSYAIGKVEGTTEVGGLIGQASDLVVENSFWDTENTGQTTSAGEEAIGKTREQMFDSTIYDSWDTDVWSLIGGRGAAIVGYEMGEALPYLKNVTRTEDIVSGKTYSLFEGGWGGQSNKDQTDADGSAYGIANWNQLNNISRVLSNSFAFALLNNLTSTTNGYTEQVKDGDILANEGKGFNPIGQHNISAFTGIFDGAGYAIDQLHIARPDQDYVGLFGSTANAKIHNLTLSNVNIVGKNVVGSLAGEATGDEGHFESIQANGTVSGINGIGGLVGTMGAMISSLVKSSTNVNVSGTNGVGGLVGGLIGSRISESYATGSVTGVNQVGGLVGNALNHSEIENSYALATVKGDSNVGGLVGSNFSNIAHSYATGKVTSAEDSIGGLVGSNSSSGNITHSFWNVDTSAVGASGDNDNGAIGKTTNELQGIATFNGWDISNQGGEDTVWRIYEGSTAPLLRNFFSDTISLAGKMQVASTTRVYDTTRDVVVTLSDVNWTKDNEGFTLNNDLVSQAKYQLDSKNAGERDIIGGYYSSQLGYDIINDIQPVTVTITPKDLNVTGLSAEDRVYNASSNATLNGNAVINAFKGDDINLTGRVTGAFDNKNAGENKLVTVTGLTITGDDAQNYRLISPNLTATISAKELIISGLTAENKVYDGNQIATIVINGVEYVGLIKGDDVSVSAAGEFDNKNVGTDKDVTIASTYTGMDVSNYAIQNQTTTQATITAKDLMISGLSAENKVYDGNQIATIVINGVEYAGLVEGDDVTISATGEFDSKNVGADILVTISSKYEGEDVNNYTITNQDTTTASISPKALTVAGMNAKDKFYDGNRTAELVGGELVGVIDGEQLSFTGQTAQFASSIVGTHPVSVSGLSLVAVKNADLNNYTLITPEEIRAKINPQAGADTGAQQRDIQVNIPQNQPVSTTLTASLVSDTRVVAEPVSPEQVTVEAAAAAPVNAVEQPVVRNSSVTVDGAAVSLSFSQNADVSNLQLGNGSIATDEIIQPGLPIYQSSGGIRVLDSVVDISDRGNAVSATTGAADLSQAEPEFDSPVIEQTALSLTNEEGSEEIINVSLLEDGTLIIDLSDNASLSDSRQATLMGVAAVKRAGITVDRLKAIVINR